jgi:hypothetical protein
LPPSQLDSAIPVHGLYFWALFSVFCFGSCLQLIDFVKQHRLVLSAISICRPQSAMVGRSAPVAWTESLPCSKELLPQCLFTQALPLRGFWGRGEWMQVLNSGAPCLEREADVKPTIESICSVAERAVIWVWQDSKRSQETSK